MIARPFQGRLGAVFLFAMAAASVLLAVTLTSGADHRDSPASTGDAPADITDVYAFRSPAANDNLVIAVGVNGLTAPAGNTSANFNNAVTYVVHVDGDGNIATDEATVSVTFSGSGDQQKFTINGLGPAIVGDVTPPSGSTTPNAPKIATSGAIKAFAGQRDDAFFFDLDAFKKFVATPCVPASGLRCTGDGAPADTFKGTNVSYIVLELPVTAVTGQPTSATGTIKAWTSTSRGAQVDRMAIPAINTALIPTAQKDAFNQGNPGTDAAAFNATSKTTIDGLRTAVDTTFGNAQDGGPLGNLTSQQVADALIPDIVTINFAQPVQFPNGRRLQDDVIDAALGIVLNRGGAAGIADGIAANDKTFGTAFPYLADPFQPAATPAPTAAPTAAPGQLPGTGGDQADDGMSNLWMIAIAIAGAALVLGGGTLAVQRRNR